MTQLTSGQIQAKKKAKEFFFPSGGGATSASVSLNTGIRPSSDNIIGIGIGAKLTDGTAIAGQEALHVYVRVKIPPQFLGAQELVPTQFDGLPTDVIEVGEVTALQSLKTWQRFGRHRPLSCGVSVGHPLITAGTLGCLVEKDGNHYLLSNNHVLANCNAASLGDHIIQPGAADGGMSPADNLATLSAFQSLDFTGAANEIDAAIALVGAETQTTVEAEIIDIGLPSKTLKAAVQYQSVRKHGRTTGHTVGVVMALSVDLWVNYPPFGRAWFEEQISIVGVGSLPFSQGGDSGSLIVDAVTREPVALLFAGGNQITYANPIDKVLSHFGVSIVGQ